VVAVNLHANNYFKASQLAKTFMEIFLKKFDLAVKIKAHLAHGKFDLLLKSNS
jgi:hypothetical protein